MSCAMVSLPPERHITPARIKRSTCAHRCQKLYIEVAHNEGLDTASLPLAIRYCVFCPSAYIQQYRNLDHAANSLLKHDMLCDRPAQ